ncbi:MAG: CHASE3 domain-containing protein [Allosphingosinicella sp.]
MQSSHSAAPSPRPAVPHRGIVSLAALGAIPLILLLLGYLLSAEFENSRRLRGEVERSHRARGEVQRMLSLHQDIETGQRGYVMTGNRAFLEPYETAREQVGESIEQVERTLGPQSPWAAELARLRAASQSKLDFSERTVALRAAGAADEATALIASGTGKALMGSIRGIVAQIDAAERAHLEEATARADAARRSSQHFTYGLLALFGLLLFGAAYLNGKSTAERKLALRRLEDLTARQEAIFDNAKDGIITLNESGSIESLNPAAARMYGYEEAELLRRDIGLLFEVAPDQGEIETFLKRLQRRRKGDVGRIQEFMGRRKDGSVFPSDVAVSPVPLEDGMRYVAIVRDITERKQVDQMKSEFVSTVSHELRTPLTSIAGSLGLLAGGAAGALPDAAKRLVGIAHSNSERLVRLINDILDIEKIESGKMAFDIQAVPLAPILDQAVQANRAFAERYGVSFRLHEGPADAAVMADPDRLMQVLTNLLSNAAKFSPEGGEVDLCVLPLDRRYRITVADKGAGIPDEFKPRIFGKFAQADSSDTRQKGGTGLGLSIVREIVLRLGGAVSFDSKPGEGTAFHVDLPAAGQNWDEAPAPDGGALILHVDDDPDVLKVVQSAFAGRAHVVAVTGVEAAARALAAERFDLVILDVALPDGSGFDLLPALRRPGGRAIPVVLFTAQDAGPELAERVEAVLTKSKASLGRLVETVEGLLPRGKRRGGEEA